MTSDDGDGAIYVGGNVTSFGDASGISIGNNVSSYDGDAIYVGGNITVDGSANGIYVGRVITVDDGYAINL